MWCHAQRIDLREQEGRVDVWSSAVFSPQSPLPVMELCFPGDG